MKNIRNFIKMWSMKSKERNVKKKKRKEVNEASTPKRKSCDERLKCTNISDLPAEVLLKIFYWFTNKELVFTIAFVCQKWCKLSRDRSLWKELYLREDEEPLSHLLTLLSYATRLETLEIVGRTDVVTILEYVRRARIQIDNLVINRCKSTRRCDMVSMDLLIDICNQNHSLLNLFVVDTPLRSTQLCHIRENSLSRVSNAYFRHVISTFRTLTRPLEELHDLCHLKVQSTQYNYKNRDVNVLCSKLWNSLTSLTLTAPFLKDVALKEIATCENLETLIIRQAIRITYVGILELIELKRLTTLEISLAHKVHSWVWCDLFTDGQWSQLKVLGLTYCEYINDEVLSCVSRHCPNLEKLNLSTCINVTHNGLSNVIKCCKHVKYLKLALTSPDIARCFPLLPECLPDLETLIYTARINSEQQHIVIDLMQTMHHLKVRKTELLISTDRYAHGWNFLIRNIE